MQLLLLRVSCVGHYISNLFPLYLPGNVGDSIKIFDGGKYIQETTMYYLQGEVLKALASQALLLILATLLFLIHIYF